MPRRGSRHRKKESDRMNAQGEPFQSTVTERPTLHLLGGKLGSSNIHIDQRDAVLDSSQSFYSQNEIVFIPARRVKLVCNKDKNSIRCGDQKLSDSVVE